jgi:hypothetical protein
MRIPVVSPLPTIDPGAIAGISVIEVNVCLIRTLSAKKDGRPKP